MLHSKKTRATMLKQLNDVINKTAECTPDAEDNSGIWMIRSVHAILESLNNDLGKKK